MDVADPSADKRDEVAPERATAREALLIFCLVASSTAGYLLTRGIHCCAWVALLLASQCREMERELTREHALPAFHMRDATGACTARAYDIGRGELFCVASALFLSPLPPPLLLSSSCMPCTAVAVDGGLLLAKT